jgi:hypothetical protein
MFGFPRLQRIAGNADHPQLLTIIKIAFRKPASGVQIIFAG